MNWIETVNALGQRRSPFVVLLDFLGQDCRLWDIQDPANPRSILGSSNKVSLEMDGFCVGDRVGNMDMHHVEGFTILEPPSQETFCSMVAACQYQQRAGDSWLANITARSEIALPGEVGLGNLFHQVTAPCRLWAQIGPQEEILSFSPEKFVSISPEGLIETNPMKGTILRTPGSDAQLLGSTKELAEHITVVDLLRNDLGQVAQNIRVPEFRYLEAITTGRGELWATSSRIEGTMVSGWQSSLGDTIHRLLPGGSISGAPKQKTLEIIQSIETLPRGFYTGVVGYFTGDAFYSYTLIRFIHGLNHRYWYHSGCGITIYSDPLEEYKELLAKVYLPLKNSRKIHG